MTLRFGRRILTFAVLTTLALAGEVSRAGAPQPADRFAQVTEWRLSFDWEADGQRRTAEGELTLAATVSLSGHADYHLVRSTEDEGLVWRMAEDDAPRGQIGYEGRKTLTGPRGDGDFWVDRWTTDVVRMDGGSAALRVYPERGSYEVNGSLGFVQREVVAQAGVEPKVEESRINVRMGARDDKFRAHPKLPTTGLVLSGSHEFPESVWPFIDIEPGMNLESWGLIPWTTMKVSWTLTPWRARDDEKMVLEPVSSADYQAWLPTPPPEAGLDFGTPTTLKVRAVIRPKTPGGTPRKGRIDFRLDSVTNNVGLCSNFPRDGKQKADLRFKPAKGLVIGNDPRHAYTDGDVSEAEIEIEALDTGAWGRLTAESTSLGLRAEDARTGRYTFSVPLDDDGNHIADAWEKNAGLSEHHPQRWDEDPEPRGQKEAGDGISLYREYRGFVVLERDKRVFRRLDPIHKELFVIDKGHSLDAEAWEAASGIKALFLDDELVKGEGRTDGRIVDFNYLDGTQHAVRIETMPGKEDPDGLPKADPQWFGYEGSEKEWKPGHSPKDALYLRIFPARIREHVDEYADWLKRGLADPGGPAGADLQKWLNTVGLPWNLAEQAGKTLDEATRARLARQIQTGSAIHELGHASGVPGHVIPKGQENAGKESSLGAPRCPMSYPDEARNTRFILLQPLFARDAKLMRPMARFCEFDASLDVNLPTEQRYNCWRKLSVKD